MRRSCRGSLNRSMRHTKHEARLSPFVVSSHRFLSRAPLPFTLASIKNYGMRWNGCVALGLTLRIIVVVLVGGRSALCIYFTDGDRLHTILKLLPMLSQCRMPIEAHAQLYPIRSTTKIRSHICGPDLYSLLDTRIQIKNGCAHLCSVLLGCLDSRWHSLSILLRVTFLPYRASRRGQTKNVYRIFLPCIFLFKYLSTDDALNYPKAFFIRSRQMPSSHLSAGIFTAVYFAQFYSNPESVRNRLDSSPFQ